ncbi:MAG: hypothetical protein K2M82_05200, partial [Lachnospiraceae bacterium]|nr:hypothetical protein [Lachnospiraceae bacterium]
MTRAIIKNARFKFLVSAAALFLIFSVLMEVEGFTPTEAVRIVLGGSVLGRPILVTSFMAYIAMLQFINIDAIDYLLNENTYLLVRY